MFVQSFEPIADPLSRILILGTMPGRTSISRGQYYAHPRNAFWSITGTILGFDPAAPYEIRVAGLLKAGVALWDVLKSCDRQGSLDSRIDPSTEVPNDLPAFLEYHPHVRRICFNGAGAEALFSKHFKASPPRCPGLEYVRLPSTSPANASMSKASKMIAWLAIKDVPEPGSSVRVTAVPELSRIYRWRRNRPNP